MSPLPLLDVEFLSSKPYFFLRHPLLENTLNPAITLEIYSSHLHSNRKDGGRIRDERLVTESSASTRGGERREGKRERDGEGCVRVCVCVWGGEVAANLSSSTLKVFRYSAEL